MLIKIIKDWFAINCQKNIKNNCVGLESKEGEEVCFLKLGLILGKY